MEAAFKRDVSLQERMAAANAMKFKYPTKLPIYFTKTKSSKLPGLDKNKCMTPCVARLSDVICGLRTKLSLPKDLSLFLFVNGDQMVPGDSFVLEVYESKKDEDGFLYLQYGEQEAMGAS